MTEEKNIFVQISKAMAGAVAQAEAATVLVNARRRLPSSGIAFAEDLILTADHVVERDEEIEVILPDGKSVSAQVVGRDPSSDLALLRLSEAAATPVETVSEEPGVGEMVLALGRPSKAGVEASLGVVSAINGPVRTRRGGLIERFLRTDAIPLPGFSGGPLVNAEGKIIGINTSGLSHGMLISIPAKVAWKTAQILLEYGGIKRGYLGVNSQVVEVPETGRAALGREQSTGLLLVHIEEGSPAAASELMVGDIIAGVAGQPVSDHDELFACLTGDVVGKPTAINVLRGGKLESIEVTVGERPARQGRSRDRGERHSDRRHARHGHHHP